MSGVQEAARVPVVVTLNDGNDYEFAPVTMGMLSRFCQWVNRREQRSISKVVEIDEMMRKAASIDGVLHLAWLSVSKAHPKLTEQQLGDITEFGDLKRIVDSVIDVPDEDDEDTDGSDPTKVDLQAGDPTGPPSP